MTFEEYLDFCIGAVGGCVKEVGSSEHKVISCLEKKMKEKFGDGYNPKFGYKAAKEAYLQYH